jgi:hypothetical protein
VSFEVRFFRGADCDYLVVVKVRERLSLNKQTNKFHIETFHLKKLNEAEGKNIIGLKSQIGPQLWKT